MHFARRVAIAARAGTGAKGLVTSVVADEIRGVDVGKRTDPRFEPERARRRRRRARGRRARRRRASRRTHACISPRGIDPPWEPSRSSPRRRTSPNSTSKNRRTRTTRTEDLAEASSEASDGGSVEASSEASTAGSVEASSPPKTPSRKSIASSSIANRLRSIPATVSIRFGRACARVDRRSPRPPRTRRWSVAAKTETPPRNVVAAKRVKRKTPPPPGIEPWSWRAAASAVRRGGTTPRDTAARAKWRSASATVVAPLGVADEDGNKPAHGDVSRERRRRGTRATIRDSCARRRCFSIADRGERRRGSGPRPRTIAYASAMDLDVDVSFTDGVRARAYDADGAALVEAEARTIDLTGERLGAPRAEPGGDRAREPAAGRFVADDVRVAVRQNLATNVPRVGLRRVFRAVRVGGSRGPALAPPPPPDAWATEPGNDLDEKRENRRRKSAREARTRTRARTRANTRVTTIVTCVTWSLWARRGTRRASPSSPSTPTSPRRRRPSRNPSRFSDAHSRATRP